MDNEDDDEQGDWRADEQQIALGLAPVPPPRPDADASWAALTPEEQEAKHAAWWRERRQAADELVSRSRRSWAAMQGWAAIETEEDWLAIGDRAAEDWASGQALVTMLGGQRYLDPPRTALLLHLWHHYVAAYRPEGPAEYMTIVMALVSFHHLIRVNEFAGNLEARLESTFFSATDPIQVRAMQKDGYPGRVTTDLRLDGRALVDQLGQDVLPLLDRLNRMVIRNLKALRDLKAAPITLNVTNLGQLNVGQSQTNVPQPTVEAREQSPDGEVEPVRLVGKHRA